jgi:hypothetical protein
MEHLDAAAISAARSRLPARDAMPFEPESQKAAFSAFINDVLEQRK